MTDQNIYDEHFYVVCDAQGFVGAYKEANMMITLRNKYAPTPFLVQRFRLTPGIQQDEIWNVLYKANDIVAFASNDKEAAKTALSAYNELGLSYEDDVDFWNQPLNKINISAEERLDSIKRAHEMYMAGTLNEPNEVFDREMEKINKLLEPSKFSPIERFLRENEKITIFDCVIPVSLSYADDTLEPLVATDDTLEPLVATDDVLEPIATDGLGVADGAPEYVAPQHSVDEASAQQKQEANQQDQHSVNTDSVSASELAGSIGGLSPEIETKLDSSRSDAQESHDASESLLRCDLPSHDEVPSCEAPS